MSAFIVSPPGLGIQRESQFCRKRFVSPISLPAHHRPIFCSPRACTAAAPSESAEIAVIKTTLFNSLRGLDRGLALDADSDSLTPQESDVENAIEQLEDLNSVPIPTRDQRVFGNWRLIYTSSSITRYFGGVTGLQRLLPEGDVGRITQELNYELGTATISELLYFDIPFRSDKISIEATVSGKFRASSEIRHVWSPEKIRVAWFSWFAETWKTIRAFQVADITYLDENLRITRGQNGSVFVYRRFDPSNPEDDEEDYEEYEDDAVDEVE